ncbi:DNA/RNA helicase domain-containing protein [Streptomyces mirabilis]
MICVRGSSRSAAKNARNRKRASSESRSRDRSIRRCGRAPLAEDDFARCVRHAYHVLMTRASRATVLYSTDEETRTYLRDLVGEVQIHGLRPTWENLPPEARVSHLPRPRRGDPPRWWISEWRGRPSGHPPSHRVRSTWWLSRPSSTTGEPARELRSRTLREGAQRELTLTHKEVGGSPARGGFDRRVCAPSGREGEARPGPSCRREGAVRHPAGRRVQARSERRRPRCRGVYGPPRAAPPGA